MSDISHACVAYGDEGGMRQLSRYIEYLRVRKVYTVRKSVETRELDWVGENEPLDQDKWLEKAKDGAAIVVTATSSGEVNVERDCWRILEKENVPYRVVLDNWCNFDKRLKGGDTHFHPSLVVTTDKVAYRIAKRELGSLKVILLEECCDARFIANQTLRFKSRKEKTTLLVLPPLDSLDKKERARIGDLLKNIKDRIRIRLHPRDRSQASSKILGISLEGSEISTVELHVDLAECTRIIGFDSYALYSGMLAGLETCILRDYSESGSALKELQNQLG